MGGNCSTPETPNQENILMTMLKIAQCGNGANSATREQCTNAQKDQMLKFTEVWHKEEPASSHCVVGNKSEECNAACAKYLNGGKTMTATSNSTFGGHCSKALGNLLHEDPTFTVTSAGNNITHKMCDAFVQQFVSKGGQLN